MGRSAYWNAGSDSLASLALGDANRGAFLALQSAVSTRRSPSPPTPPSDGLLPVRAHTEPPSRSAGPPPSTQSRARLQPGLGVQHPARRHRPPERRASSCSRAYRTTSQEQGLLRPTVVSAAEEGRCYR